MEHKNIRDFEFPAFVGDESENAFALIFEPADGEKFMLSMSRTVAARIAEQLSAALMQLAREGAPTTVPASPEKLLRFGAHRQNTKEGEPYVALLIVGDRSQPVLGALTLTDARRLGANLMAEAEFGGPKKATKQ